MISTLPSERLIRITFTPYLQRLQQHPWRVAASIGVFGLLWYLTSVSAALFWSVLLLALLLDLPARPFLIAALITLTLTPVLYFVDRPSQAERVGVLVFALLALGTVINLGNNWRQRTKQDSL